MTRNHFAGSHGDDANAVLGYNFSLLKWLALLCVLVLTNLACTNSSPTARQSA